MHSSETFNGCKPTMPGRRASRSGHTVHIHLPGVVSADCAASAGGQPTGNLPDPTTCFHATFQTGHPSDSLDRTNRHKCSKLLAKQNLLARKQRHPMQQPRHGRILQQATVTAPALYCQLLAVHGGHGTTTVLQQSFLYCSLQDSSICAVQYGNTCRMANANWLARSQPSSLVHSVCHPAASAICVLTVLPHGLQFAITTSQATNARLTRRHH